MELILWRHAEAEPGEPDAQRALTSKGIRHAARMGAYATAALKQMQDRHEIIGDVRCPGLLIGVELVKDRDSKEPATKETIQVYELGMERGVIFGSTKYAGLGNVVKLKPPLCVTQQEMDRALSVLDEVLTEIA